MDGHNLTVFGSIIASIIVEIGDCSRAKIICSTPKRTVCETKITTHSDFISLNICLPHLLFGTYNQQNILKNSKLPVLNMTSRILINTFSGIYKLLTDLVQICLLISKCLFLSSFIKISLDKKATFWV